MIKISKVQYTLRHRIPYDGNAQFAFFEPEVSVEVECSEPADMQHAGNHVRMRVAELLAEAQEDIQQFMTTGVSPNVVKVYGPLGDNGKPAGIPIGVAGEDTIKGHELELSTPPIESYDDDYTLLEDIDPDDLR